MREPEARMEVQSKKSTVTYKLTLWLPLLLRDVPLSTFVLDSVSQQLIEYRGTSLIQERLPLGPYSSRMYA